MVVVLCPGKVVAPGFDAGVVAWPGAVVGGVGVCAGVVVVGDGVAGLAMAGVVTPVLAPAGAPLGVPPPGTLFVV